MPTTESPNQQHSELDLYSVEKLIDVFVEDQLNAVYAVQASSAQIAQAVAASVPRMELGGRLIYVGAGTSGRLGVLDSVELQPTFSWPIERAVGLLAGGHSAMFVAVEGAEDDALQGALDIEANAVSELDVVLLLAASGSTPYVMGALHAAKEKGALTVGIVNNINTPLALLAEIGIVLETGSELISGSTRLKAGTAQKIALNSFSSALMIRLNKTYGNLMVDLKPNNAKLHLRAIHLTMLACDCDASTANNMLHECDFEIKVAIVALQKNESISAAKKRLAEANGNVRLALKL
ncbi:N-acetylmuramic acid 6-phosphate etherase [Solimicrobium silvestre]|uniref:N-acetylmuramic acid 6-phosphate etherase n=1 Tax=Solimicrobium silvestre TaxID=2099400 RepID=A0A2S9H4E5_9BURK|nr:N-acetylmuramic acid 6-phosphate etherase [Solimicrobium silvestre]PRC94838.1 putative sugar phosphate isomerase [Solimicrobium silvestre]